ncbi:MAG TPA: DUF1062 domain-containing protein [Candidatus Pelethocola excrementipullorum]|nr:DUF1062 domain-containing protein [Candidatus Pelethocola excrementipullorum]
MQKVIWELQYHSLLPVSKYCKKCGKTTEYASSGQFRINAQRKYLDIWLIYKCINCNTTWNVTIFSRINPKSLSQKLLDQFHNNDEALADYYAMDIENLQRNHCEIGLPDYTVTGDSIPYNETVELHIKTKYQSPIKVSTIIRNKLQISQKTYANMIAEGLIKSTSVHDLRKCKLLDGIVLNINMRKEIAPF